MPPAPAPDAPPPPRSRRALRAVLRAHGATPGELAALRQALLALGLPDDRVRRVLANAEVMDWYFSALRAEPQEPSALLMDLCDRLYVA